MLFERIISADPSHLSGLTWQLSGPACRDDSGSLLTVDSSKVNQELRSYSRPPFCSLLFQRCVRHWTYSGTYSWFLQEEHWPLNAFTSADVCFKWAEYGLITCCRSPSASSLNFHHQRALISLLPRRKLSNNKSHQFDHQRHGWKHIRPTLYTDYTISWLLTRAMCRTSNKNIHD